ncbi:type II RES/Xre toxin-antitoxin system antitoxin [Spirosoma utsteinense]|uniref:Toxin-antitoxin system antitoxin component (TIGR02293 family) n=1 Tax=Spirosoma utsteinense TaxID=2585773 RepID=A0ABR6WBF5_9BACT|nr:antitoxin Xre-like helix-turn-helix domain-containing protein [Spirosoma utsteinense]MBC3785291.1 putative toxin-antitoxin system antitoxin component (TIGR02293 family) [Spirosoma utsteinense]MBC3793905.1 putative toxin-antitoxin system antitoxin component (TIGR02293 family) [Spirosoma utsteinense]
MQVSVRKIMEGLGGDRFVKRPVRHEFDLIDIVKEGLPMESVAFLQTNFGFTNKEMSHILAISESTYQRRIRAKERMTQDETEKAISLSELYAKGIDVFRNQSDFETWLQTKIPAMGNQRPTAILDSMIGRQHVMDALNRILHGIFS